MTQFAETRRAEKFRGEDVVDCSYIERNEEDEKWNSMTENGLMVGD